MVSLPARPSISTVVVRAASLFCMVDAPTQVQIDETLKTSLLIA